MEWTSYLITEVQRPIETRPFTRRDGSVIYAVDQLHNPNSVFLTAGGTWGERIIIAGRIASLSDYPASKELMGLYKSAVERQFMRMDSYWVGPLALTDFRNGRRLTTSITNSPEFDLRER